MSAIKKGIKKVGDWVSDNWKSILVAAAVVFTAGIATVGIGAYSSAVGSQGLWAATGSTMWAGATSVAGTFGVGGGASGSVAAGAGMEGATLMTGALAQGTGLASAGQGANAGFMGSNAAQAMGQAASANVGAYTGPGSSFMGGGGSVFGGSADPAVTAGSQAAGAQAGTQAAQGAQGAQAAQGAQQAGGLMQQGTQQGGGMFSKGSLGGDMLRSAAPTLMYTAGNYLAARGEEEAGKPKAMWGVDMDSGEAMQPENLPQQQGQQQGQPQPGQRFRGPDGKEYEIGPNGQPRPVQQRGRVSAPPPAPWMQSQQQAPSVNNPQWQRNQYGVG